MDTQNEITQKSARPGVLILYCLVSTAIMLYLGLFTVFPILDFAGVAAIGVLCACYGLLLKKGYFIPCVIPVGAAVAAVVFSYGSQGAFGTAMLASLMNVIFPFILAAVLNAGVVRKADTGAIFALLSAVGAVYVLSLLMLAVYEIYGSVNADTAGRAVNDAAAFLGSVFSEAPKAVIPFEEGSAAAAQYQSVYAEYELMLKELGKTIELTFKLTVPSIAAMCAMLEAAVIFIFYKPLARLAGMADECFDGGKWSFEVTPLSALLFEIVFFIYIILMFFSKSTVLNVAFMNICSVLTVPFAYIGLRHLVRIIAGKLNSKAAAVAIVTAASACLTLLLGTGIFTLAALFGASSVTKKSVEEKLK